MEKEEMIWSIIISSLSHPAPTDNQSNTDPSVQSTHTHISPCFILEMMNVTNTQVIYYN